MSNNEAQSNRVVSYVIKFLIWLHVLWYESTSVCLLLRAATDQYRVPRKYVHARSLQYEQNSEEPVRVKPRVNISFTISIKIKLGGSCVQNKYKLTVGRIIIWNRKYKFPVRSRYRLWIYRRSWNQVKYLNIICGFVFNYSKQWDDKMSVSETIEKNYY